jgi:hypothetical protein
MRDNRLGFGRATDKHKRFSRTHERIRPRKMNLVGIFNYNLLFWIYGYFPGRAFDFFGRIGPGGY